MKGLVIVLSCAVLSGCATAKGMRTDLSDGLERVSEMIRPETTAKKPNER